MLANVCAGDGLLVVTVNQIISREVEVEFKYRYRILSRTYCYTPVDIEPEDAEFLGPVRSSRNNAPLPVETAKPARGEDDVNIQCMLFDLLGLKMRRTTDSTIFGGCMNSVQGP